MCEGEMVILQGLSFSRSGAFANFHIPFVTGQTVHIFVFFENEDKTKYSTSQHAMVIISLLLKIKQEKEDSVSPMFHPATKKS
jgi:hypothetical protein